MVNASAVVKCHSTFTVAALRARSHAALSHLSAYRPRRRSNHCRFGRKILHLPLKRFSGQLVERLRAFHVLNGKQVRSYAAEFIREM